MHRANHLYKGGTIEDQGMSPEGHRRLYFRRLYRYYSVDATAVPSIS